MNYTTITFLKLAIYGGKSCLPLFMQFIDFTQGNFVRKKSKSFFGKAVALKIRDSQISCGNCLLKTQTFNAS